MAKKGVFHAEYALAAAGRRPNVDNIGLENLNIEKDARGVPVADPLTMQTSIPHIFYRRRCVQSIAFVARSFRPRQNCRSQCRYFPEY